MSGHCDFLFSSQPIDFFLVMSIQSDLYKHDIHERERMYEIERQYEREYEREKEYEREYKRKSMTESMKVRERV